MSIRCDVIFFPLWTCKNWKKRNQDELSCPRQKSKLPSEKLGSSYQTYAFINICYMNRSTSLPAVSNRWILPFLLGASTSISLVWFSQKWKRWSTISLATKSKINKSIKTDREEVLDHEQLPNRMLRKAETVIQWRTSRLVLVIERCTNGTSTAVYYD